MKVIDFIKDIANSDLRQITLRDVGTGLPTDTEEQKEHMSTLISFVNQGLISLYKKFPLQIETYEADVEAYDTYTESLMEDAQIKLPDTALSVVGVTTDKYVDVPVDDKNIEFLYSQNSYNKLFLRTIAYNTFVVSGKNEDKVTAIYINYTTVPNSVGLEDNIPLNVMFLEALRMYVAYRGYSSVHSVTPVGDEGIGYLKKYEALCTELESTVDTMYNYDSFDVYRLWSKGFV
jgi:hypothetical protein